MLLVLGLPVFFLELSIGQYASLGCIALFDRLSPLFKVSTNFTVELSHTIVHKCKKKQTKTEHVIIRLLFHKRSLPLDSLLFSNHFELQGLGWGMSMVNCYILTYYTVVVAWAIHYLYSTLASIPSGDSLVIL